MEAKLHYFQIRTVSEVVVNDSQKIQFRPWHYSDIINTLKTK
jgi:hypothetical protein